MSFLSFDFARPSRASSGLAAGASLFALLALGACGSSHNAPTQSSAVIGTGGGTVSVDQGDAAGTRVEVPAGAVDVATTFSIVIGTADQVTMGMHAIGPMVTFGPEGAVFAMPVHIVVRASREPVVLLTRPHGAGAWTRVDGAVWNASAGTVSADVMHFSDFVPVEADTFASDGGYDAGPMIERDAGIDCSDPRFADYPVCRMGYECDLFAGGCAAGYASCYPPSETSTHGTCSSAGSAVAGAACNFVDYDHPTECGSQYRCDATTPGTAGVCRIACDTAHPCAGDGTPTIYNCTTPDASAAFGFCEPAGMRCVPSASREISCTDGVDNDCDGAIDCADADCRDDRACVHSACDAVAGTGCAAGQHCGLRDVDASVASPIVAACFANGAAAAGAGCMSSADCGAGLTCAAVAGSDPMFTPTHYFFTTFEGYFARGGGVCVAVCPRGDWSASTCAAGQVCEQIMDELGGSSGFGACYGG